MPILTTRVLLIRSSNVKHINQQVYDDALIDEKRLCYDTAVIAADVPRLQATREAVQAGLEQARQAKITGSSLQSSVTILTEDEELHETLVRYEDELADMFVVSSLAVQAKGAAADAVSPEQRFEQDLLVNGERKGRVVVSPPEKAKCPRCWRYQSEQEDQLCRRCEDVVAAQPS